MENPAEFSIETIFINQKFLSFLDRKSDSAAKSTFFMENAKEALKGLNLKVEDAQGSSNNAFKVGEKLVAWVYSNSDAGTGSYSFPKAIDNNCALLLAIHENEKKKQLEIYTLTDPSHPSSVHDAPALKTDRVKLRAPGEWNFGTNRQSCSIFHQGSTFTNPLEKNQTFWANISISQDPNLPDTIYSKVAEIIKKELEP